MCYNFRAIIKERLSFRQTVRGNEIISISFFNYTINLLREVARQIWMFTDYLLIPHVSITGTIATINLMRVNIHQSYAFSVKPKLFLQRSAHIEVTIH